MLQRRVHKQRNHGLKPYPSALKKKKEENYLSLATFISVLLLQSNTIIATSNLNPIKTFFPNV